MVTASLVSEDGVRRFYYRGASPAKLPDRFPLKFVFWYLEDAVRGYAALRTRQFYLGVRQITLFGSKMNNAGTYARGSGMYIITLAEGHQSLIYMGIVVRYSVLSKMQFLLSCRVRVRVVLFFALRNFEKYASLCV